MNITAHERACIIWDDAESSGDPIDFIQAEIEEAERTAFDKGRLKGHQEARETASKGTIC